RIAGAGDHRLEYFATDQAGNEEVLHTIVIPVSGGWGHPPPIVLFRASGTPGENGWYISTVDVSLTPSSSNGSTPSIAYRVDDGPYVAMGKATVLPESWSLGSHVVTVKAWDVAGNEGTQTIAFRVEPNGGSSATGLISAQAPSGSGSLSLALGFLVSISVLLL